MLTARERIFLDERSSSARMPLRRAEPVQACPRHPALLTQASMAARVAVSGVFGDPFPRSAMALFCSLLEGARGEGSR